MRWRSKPSGCQTESSQLVLAIANLPASNTHGIEPRSIPSRAGRATRSRRSFRTAKRLRRSDLRSSDLLKKACASRVHLPAACEGSPTKSVNSFRTLDRWRRPAIFENFAFGPIGADVERELIFRRWHPVGFPVRARGFVLVVERQRPVGIELQRFALSAN
jgi:hypothetical protein